MISIWNLLIYAILIELFVGFVVFPRLPTRWSFFGMLSARRKRSSSSHEGRLLSAGAEQSGAGCRAYASTRIQEGASLLRNAEASSYRSRTNMRIQASSTEQRLARND